MKHIGMATIVLCVFLLWQHGAVRFQCTDGMCQSETFNASWRSTGTYESKKECEGRIAEIVAGTLQEHEINNGVYIQTELICLPPGAAPGDANFTTTTWTKTK